MHNANLYNYTDLECASEFDYYFVNNLDLAQNNTVTHFAIKISSFSMFIFCLIGKLSTI